MRWIGDNLGFDLGHPGFIAPEFDEVKRLAGELGQIFTLEEMQAHPAFQNIMLRLTARRGSVPRTLASYALG